MGKVVGLTGSVSGKIGNVVYAVTNGIQTARVYQPNVTNPKSTLQKSQRAKANLIGQLSARTPWQAIVGLGSNRRARRSRFLKLGLRAASTIIDGNEITARIKTSEIVFSEGAIMPTISAKNYSAAVRSVSLTLDKMSGVSDEDFAASGVLVVILMSSISGEFVSEVYRVVTSKEFNNNEYTLILPHAEEGAYLADFYLCPFSTVDGNSLSAVAERIYGDGEDLAAALTYNPAALPVNWGDSKWVYQANYTPEP